MFARYILIGVIFLFFSVAAQSAERPQISSDHSGGTSHSSWAESGPLAATRADSLVLIGPWGSGALVNGQFQNQVGEVAWNGWTHRDLTEYAGVHWQISSYQADNLGPEPSAENQALWCGDSVYAACDEEDLAGGYGNGWDEVLAWNGAVFDPTQPVQVQLTADLNLDIEPSYDFFYLEALTAELPLEILSLDGVYTNHQIDVSFTVDPENFQGLAMDEVGLRFRFSSDPAWSDEDCLWPTAGAVQIDNIEVTLTQGEDSQTDLTDFESGLGSWTPEPPLAVGDFTQIWTGLYDLDPCRQNLSPQVAFIDDGLVVPGVGPTMCEDWCYGPYGYVVNHSGGRWAAQGEPDRLLINAVESPVIAWPEAGLDAALLEFDVYRHEEINGFNSTGLFYFWKVRSTDSEDPAEIEDQPWRDRNFIYFGGPEFTRDPFVVTDLLVPGRKFVQVQMGVTESGNPSLPSGTNGTPAPYFDNVRLTATEVVGPSMFGRDIDLAQDAFPDQGFLDPEDLGTNSVRFDMAKSLARYSDEDVIPGDSLVVDIAALREGGELVGDVLMHYNLRTNPLFDAYRTSGLPSQGTVVGEPASNGSYFPADRFAFDLPDENFLFPGDVLHYFFSATEDAGGVIQTAMIPADTTGFSDFSGALSYDTSFTMRALPSVWADASEPGGLATPEVLFWNDFAKGGGQDEWHGALANIGLVLGRDYDTYLTNGPDSGVGNGLGGRATPALLGLYDDLLYSSGTLARENLETEGSAEAGGDDVALLDAWLRQGGKDLLMTGDGVVASLSLFSSASPEFRDQWLGVEFVEPDIGQLIQNQTAPLVRAIPGNGALPEGMTWAAYGGCPGLNQFDAVIAEHAEGAIQLAEFLDPAGNPGAYSYSAGTLKPNAEFDARVITLPYDLLNIYTPIDGEKILAPLATRALLLQEILLFFGVQPSMQWASPVPGAQSFSLGSYPNPFNPTTRIAYTMPQAGHLSLKVFDVKGRLVKTLIDQHQETSGHVMWDGVDDRGQKVGSGVYFAEARTAGQVLVQKMLMVK